MEIQRDILKQLAEWKSSRYRKPLVLQGARQVGKSWILKKFGETCFSQYIYVNFDDQPELKKDFARTKDPQRIIKTLSQISGKNIKADNTLIIFDEIQECNDALNSLKYFYEQMPEYAIVCAGSLLGVALKRSGSSFPVGKVDFMYLYPVTFMEFLRSTEPQLYDFMSSVKEIEPIPEMIHSQLSDSYKTYLACGGMPEAVSRYIETKDWEQVDTVQNAILTSYTLDFSKHINNNDIPRVFKIWNNIQDQLAREDRKFRYTLIEKSARAREYESAIEWLCLSGLIHRVYSVETPKLPLSAYKKSSAFKLYLSDVGLLRNKFHLDPIVAMRGDTLFTEFKGILAENYVLQSLISQFGKEQFYWTSGNTAEVEFVLQNHNLIIPVEVKSSTNITAKSLSEYRKRYSPALSIRLSMRNMRKDNDLINIPIYMVDELKKIISHYCE